jgi:hypothetical protein
VPVLDFKHLEKRDITYFHHFKFACSIGLKMLVSSVFFLIHGVVPIIQMPPSLNLKSMADHLLEKNRGQE